MFSADSFRSIFGSFMLYTGLTWVWAVAIFMAWPWNKAPQWRPDHRIAVVCPDKEVCGINYEQLGQGGYLSLNPGEYGEIQEADAWLRWRQESGKPWQYEVTRSSWYFESSVRYNIDGDKLVLVQSRDLEARLITYALAAALFTFLGLKFRGMRQ